VPAAAATVGQFLGSGRGPRPKYELKFLPKEITEQRLNDKKKM